MVSRRAFVRALGIGGAAAATARLVAARGHEALANAWPPGQGPASQRASAAAGDSSAIYLDSNENPNGPGLRVLEAVREAFGLVSSYPYAEADALTNAIARLHGVRTSEVILGCGSAEVLRMAMQACTSRARHLVTAAPTFESPVRYARAFGVPIKAARLDPELRPNLAAMEVDGQRAGLVYLCNPNNPTGTVHRAQAVAGFVERLAVSSPQTVVLVDEAYHEYVEDPSYATAIPLAVSRPHLIVSRTFSKLHGLAGLRCGYGIAHAQTIAELARFRLETSVNQLAIAAARVAVGDTGRVDRERALNREAREYTRGLFKSIGYSVPSSQTNFIMVDLERDSRPFRESCARAGIVVGRPFPPLNNYVRISIGTMEEMQRAGSQFRRILDG